MSGRVVRLDGGAPRHIDIRSEAVADLYDALRQRAEMRERSAALLRVGDLKVGAHVAELAGIADLAAGLRIERSAVENHFAFIAGLELLHRGAAFQQRDDLADIRDGFVAKEAGFALELDAARHV